MIEKAKSRKRAKTDKSKAPKREKEGKLHEEAEAAVGKGPSGRRHLMGAGRCYGDSAWILMDKLCRVSLTTTAKMVLRPYFLSVSWETGIEETGGALEACN